MDKIDKKPPKKDTTGSVSFSDVLKYVGMIDSIGTILVSMFWTNNLKNKIINVLENIPNVSINKITEVSVISKVLRNLESSWYNELALYTSLSKDEQKFPQWDIIKFYYTIYSSTSAMSRIVCPSLRDKNHYGKIKAYNNNILIGQYKNLIIPPFNLIFSDGSINLRPIQVTSWPYGQKTHLPVIEIGLKRIQEITGKQKVSLIDFFKFFREWANYNGTHLIKHIYGPSVKSNLRRGLSNICFCFQIITENFVIKAIGFDKVKNTFENFKRCCESNMKLDVSHISDRFAVYINYYK